MRRTSLLTAETNKCISTAQGTPWYSGTDMAMVLINNLGTSDTSYTVFQGLLNHCKWLGDSQVYWGPRYT